MTTAPDDSMPARPAAVPLSYRIARLGRLIRKELSEILRDRRTIVTLVLMPLLLYPLISIALQQFFLASGLSLAADKGFHLGFLDKHEADVFLTLIATGEQIVRQSSEAKKKEGDTPRITPENVVVLPDRKALDKALLAGTIDLGIRLRGADRIAVAEAGQLRLPRDEALTCELISTSNSLRGVNAATYVERRLAALNNRFLELRLGTKDASPKVVLTRPRITVLPVAADGLVSLSALVPLILILMTITGAVYPAIDLTAGERERGTLEMLIAAPVPRLSLLFAKYVTVVSVAVLTALINLSAMVITLLVSGLSGLVFQQGGLTFLLIVQLLGLLLLFATFFSAVLLSLTSFARSFKEAQSYLVPLMLLSFAPGMMGTMPGLKLEGAFTIVPLLNIVLLSRDLLEGKAHLAAAAVIITSTLFYAMAAIAVAARFFGSEGVLYNTHNSWFELWQRPAQPQPHATVTSALMCLALMLPTWFVLHGVIAHLGLPIVDSLILVAVLSILLFAGFPLAAAWHGRIILRSGFRWHAPSVLGSIAALVLGLCVWPWVLQLLLTLRPLQTIDLSQLAERLAPFRQARAQYPALMAVCFVLPALVEELFFRGFLFSAMRSKISGPATVVTTALLFGFFHFIVTEAFALDRLLPSTLLGLLLGWVCLRTGSVIPSMLLHALHNGMLVVVGQGGFAGGEEIPVLWLVAGGVGTAAGLMLLYFGGRRS